MEEMVEALERIEKKLIASSDVYGALNYASWTIILGVYLALCTIIYSCCRTTEHFWYITGVFWALAFVFIFYINALVWKKVRHLREYHRKGIWSIMILGWIIGGIIWTILPVLWNPQSSILGFLIFIICGNMGISIAIRDYRPLMPVITSALATLMVIWGNTGQGYMGWSLGTEFVLVGYSLSTLLYLWSAFTLVGE